MFMVDGYRLKSVVAAENILMSLYIIYIWPITVSVITTSTNKMGTELQGTPVIVSVVMSFSFLFTKHSQYAAGYGETIIHEFKLWVQTVGTFGTELSLFPALISNFRDMGIISLYKFTDGLQTAVLTFSSDSLMSPLSFTDTSKW